MWQTFWSHQHHEPVNQASTNEDYVNSFPAMLEKSKTTLVWWKGDWQNVGGRSYQTSLDHIGSSNTVFAEQGWFASFLRRLTKRNRCYKVGRLHNITRGRLYWLARRCPNLFYATCAQRVLTSWQQECRSRQDGLLVTQQTFLFCLNAILNLEWSENFPRSDRCCALNG